MRFSCNASLFNGDTGYFNVDIFWQATNLHSFASWRNACEVFSIGFVHLRKIIHVFQKNRTLNHMWKVHPIRFQNFFQIEHDLSERERRARRKRVRTTSHTDEHRRYERRLLVGNGLVYWSISDPKITHTSSHRLTNANTIKYNEFGTTVIRSDRVWYRANTELSSSRTTLFIPGQLHPWNSLTHTSGLIQCTRRCDPLTGTINYLVYQSVIDALSEWPSRGSRLDRLAARTPGLFWSKRLHCLEGEQ